MAVIIIVGVLATLATIGVRKYVFAAKSSEAIHMIGAIKAAEEAYKDETFVYLNVSTNIDSYYPTQTPNGKSKVQWGGTGGDQPARWGQLGVSVGAPVQYGYACVAGKAGDNVPDPGLRTNPYGAVSTTEPWYVVKAVGDMNDDGVQAIFTSSSFSTEIFSQNEDE